MTAAVPEPVAVVGLGCVFPGAADVDAFWRNVVAADDAITTFPPGRCDPELFRFETDRGGFVDGDGLWFEPGRFGVMPRVVEDTDPDQFLALATAAAALDDAGAAPELDNDRVGVILGRGGYLTSGGAQFVQRVRTAHQLVTTLRSVLPDVGEDQLQAVKTAFVDELGALPSDAAVGVLPNMAASRLANRLDLGGPAYIVDAACASSLVAVDAAMRELDAGRCDLVLAGGVHHCDDLVLWAGFSKLGALSPSGSIRPFSRHADGILIGEGTGMLALERLSTAERRGHRVYAVLRGTGIASDGRDASLVSPNVEGQVLALERAYGAAGIAPETIDLVEGHGTATAAGDRAELETIRRVFGKADDATRAGVLGSVKSMIGHAMPAAGAAGLIKAVLAVHHGVMPPTLHAEDPHPAMAETRFRLLAGAEPWETPPGGLRRAGVNAFGFGGINGHVVVEQHPDAAPAAVPGPRRDAPGAGATAPAEPSTSTTQATPAGGPGDDFRFDAILLAGRDADDIAGQLEARVGDGGRPGADLPAPGAGPARLAVVDPNPRRLELAARALRKNRPWRGLNDVWFAPEGLVRAGGRVAFLFPGVEPTFDAELEPVARWFGRDLRPLPEGWSDLEAQGHQILAAGLLLHEVLGDLGIAPDDVAGHSMGEWTGWFAGELVPPDAAGGYLDAMRPGAFAVPDVAYLGLGCGVDQAAEVIADLDDVTISHDNCVHQSIVCGPAEAIEVARSRLAERKIVGQDIPFRSGFHSPAFAPYVPGLRPLWDRLPLQRPRIPLWSATSCARYPDDLEAVRQLATDHLVERVRFRELTERLHDDGVRVFVQPGIGSLPSFVDDTLGKRPHVSISAYSAKRAGLDQLVRVAAALWVEGVDVDFAPLARRSAGVADPGGAPGPAGTPGGHRVRLSLGTPLVRLPASVWLDDAAGTGGGRPAAAAAVPGLSHALAAAHDALLDETLTAGREVAEAFGRRGGAANGAGNGAGNAAMGDVRAAAGAGDGPAEETPAHTRAMRVDVETFPWLRDHCVIQQRRDWHDLSDAFPVVPLTALVEMMGDAARDAAPGHVVTRIEDIRAARFVTAAPPTDIVVRATPVGSGRVQVAVEAGEVDGTATASGAGRPFSRATVHLAPAPAPPPPPEADVRPLTNTRPSPRLARELYDEGWMFHGPAYHGVREVGLLGDEGIDGVIEALPTPGATLDCAAQLYGWWVLATEAVNSYVLPQSIDHVDLYAPLTPGRRLGVAVRIREVSDRIVTADLELTDAGHVVARIVGSVVRRFNSDGHLWTVSRFPGRNMMSSIMPGGYAVVDERWRDSASRELMAHLYLNAGERAIYWGLRPLDQRHWLIGRIAAKDAVRHALRGAGHDEVYPAEITVADDVQGRPYVADAPGAGTELAVSIATTPWVGAALAGTPGATAGAVARGATGVDVRPLRPVAGAPEASPLTAAEEALLPAEERAVWAARAGAAKAAAARAAVHDDGATSSAMAICAVEPAAGRLRAGDLWVTTAVIAEPVQAVPGAPTDTFSPDPAPPDLPRDDHKELVIAWTD